MDGPQTTIDLKRMAAEVSVQHGIRVDSDDPMMAVVTLNRLIFEQAIAQVLERVQAAVRDFDMAAERVQVRAGGALAQEVRDCGVVMRQELEKAFEDLSQRRKNSLTDAAGAPAIREGQKWIFVGLALALCLFGLGIWVGTRLG